MLLVDYQGEEENITTYGVLCNVLALTGTRDGDVGENDVAAVGDPVVVLGAVAEVQVLDSRVVQANSAEENRSQNVDVRSIQVIPDLTIAIEEATTVDIHIIATKLEKGSGILEDLFEGIRLPVVGVIGELNIALDVKIDVVEMCQV